VKRKVQNRVAQRAFRERKENYVNELKQKLREVQDNHVLGTRQIFYENENLRSIIRYLESENHALK
ncbi:basic-leucine zipper transcription factor, partial [Phycomyces blakesleeanus NRRL 1555(-)]